MNRNQEYINRITEDYKARVKFPNKHSAMDLDISFLLEMIKHYQQQIQTLEALSLWSLTEDEVEVWEKEVEHSSIAGYSTTSSEPLTLADRIKVADHMKRHLDDSVIDSIRDLRDAALEDLGYDYIEPEDDDFGIPDDEVPTLVGEGDNIRLFSDLTKEEQGLWLKGMNEENDISLYSNANGETEG